MTTDRLTGKARIKVVREELANLDLEIAEQRVKELRAQKAVDAAYKKQSELHVKRSRLWEEFLALHECGEQEVAAPAEAGAA